MKKAYADFFKVSGRWELRDTETGEIIINDLDVGPQEDWPDWELIDEQAAEYGYVLSDE